MKEDLDRGILSFPDQPIFPKKDAEFFQMRDQQRRNLLQAFSIPNCLVSSTQNTYELPRSLYFCFGKYSKAMKAIRGCKCFCKKVKWCQKRTDKNIKKGVYQNL